jgi:predicted GIY-YIG superfamily endonuclease
VSAKKDRSDDPFYMALVVGPPEDHWLYKVYDQEDDLLYVGITKTGLQRISEHKGDREKRWTADISRVEIEHFPTRAEAVAAEIERIIELEPRYNVTFANQRPMRPAQLQTLKDGRW